MKRQNCDYSISTKWSNLLIACARHFRRHLMFCRFNRIKRFVWLARARAHETHKQFRQQQKQLRFEMRFFFLSPFEWRARRARERAANKMSISFQFAQFFIYTKLTPLHLTVNTRVPIDVSSPIFNRIFRSSSRHLDRFEWRESNNRSFQAN